MLFYEPFIKNYPARNVIDQEGFCSQITRRVPVVIRHSVMWTYRMVRRVPRKLWRGYARWCYRMYCAQKMRACREVA